MDLSLTNADAARSFYGAVLGWGSYESNADFGGYFMFHRDGAPIAGAMPAHEGQPLVWTLYFSVDDVNATIARAQSLGATVVVPATAIDDMGQMAVLLDVGGAAFGLWQPGTFAGYSAVGESASPTWFELYAKDYAGSLAFYAELFGWEITTMSDTPAFRYSVGLVRGERAVGVMDFSAEMHASMPPYWSVYVAVDDVDAAAEAATSNGGALLVAPFDSPFGRMATFTDADGAVMSVMRRSGPSA